MLLNSKLINRMLENRGIKYEDLVPIEVLPEYDIINLKEAAKRYINLVLKNKLVGILYDTDCDGVSAGKIMEHYTAKTGVKIKRYMNADKAHGITDNVVKWVDTEEIELLIVVDAGTHDFENIEKLERRGIDVIIIDHHSVEVEKILKREKVIVVNNSYEGSPNKYLSGAGVTFRFLKEVNKTLGFGNIDRYKTWVGLSVLSDSCNILNKENIHYVNYAFQNYSYDAFLSSFTNYGSTGDMFNFTIIPLINACTRMGATDLVMTLANSESKYGMEELIAQAREVKETQDDLVLQAEEEIVKLEGNKIIICKFPDNRYRHIFGLIANRIMNRYQKSTIIVMKELDEDMYSGSFRGMGKVDMSLLGSMGVDCRGHSQACGIFFPAEQFKKQAAELLNYDYTEEDKVSYDTEVSFMDYDTIYHDLHRMAILNEFSGNGFRKLTVKVVNIPRSLEVFEYTTNTRYKYMDFEVVEFDNTKLPDTLSEMIVQPTLYKDTFTLVRCG